MNNRQKLVQQQYLNNEKAVLRQLKKSYTDSLVAINDTVKNLQLSIDGLQQEYDWMDDDDPQKAIVKSKIQSKIYQKQYQEQLQSQVGGILSEMQRSQFVTVSDYLDKCYEDGFIGSIFDLHGQGVPLTMPINQESMVKAVQLDSKISKGLYTKLGEDVDLLKKRITSEVTRAIATGSTYAQTAQRLAGQTKIGFNKAARIARTEGHRIQNSAADDAAHLAKDRGADVVKQWDSTLDGNTRESHVAVDGQIRELDEEFSNGLMFPGDPRGPAEEVIQCRCTYLQRARWAVGGSFTKMNNFTGQLETFNSPQDYDEFKKAFFSDENKKYMNYVEQLQDKYGTKNFTKVLDSMNDKEYKHYSNLLKSNPVYNKNAANVSDVVDEFTTDKVLTQLQCATKSVNDKVRTAFSNAVQDDPTTNQILNNVDKLGDVTISGGRQSKYNPYERTITLAGDSSGTVYHEWGHSLDHTVALKQANGKSDFKWFSEDLADVRKSTAKAMGNRIPDDFVSICDDVRKRINDQVRTMYVDSGELMERAKKSVIKKYGTSYSSFSSSMQVSIIKDEAQRELQRLTNRMISQDVEYNRWGCLSDILDAITKGDAINSRKLIASHGFDYYHGMIDIVSATKGVSHKENAEIFANFIEMKVGGYAEQLTYLETHFPDLYGQLDSTYKRLGKVLEEL